jgi:hypothetical protein
MVRKTILGMPARPLAATLAAIAAVTALTAFAATNPNLGKAIEAQRQLAGQRPNDAAVWNDLGNLLLLARQPGEAEAAYRKAVELDPQKTSALFNLGLLEQQHGKNREAQRLYEQVLKLEPRHAWAHYQLGTVYERKGEKARAVRSYAQAFALDPQLAFKEVNPQIVDSRLVTESMLRAYRNSSASPEVPTVFDEATRIRNLLEPAPAPAGKEAAPAATQPAQPGHPAVLRQRDLPQGPAMGQATPPGQQQGARARPGTPGGTYIQQGGAAVPSYPPPAYGTPGYTPPGAPGQAQGRQWVRPDPRSGGVITPGEGTQPGQVITPPPSGIYYRPGTPSTGRLSSVVVEANG